MKAYYDVDKETFEKYTKLIFTYQDLKNKIFKYINDSRISKDKKKQLKDYITDLLLIQCQIDTFNDQK